MTLSHVELNESRQRLHVPDERAVSGSRVTARASRESEVVANGVTKRVFYRCFLKRKSACIQEIFLPDEIRKAGFQMKGLERR